MINKKYLPSKNFIIALSAAIVLVVVIIILNYWRPSTTKYSNNNLSASDANATSSVMTLDSDGDGLPDWKEILYGTDPHNIDTDGDGTPDGEEINENRDPLKANTAPKGQEANDKIDPTLVVQSQEATAEYEKLNSTQKMAEDLMSNIIASQPADGTQMDQATMDSLTQGTLQDIPEKEYNGITQESDLNIISIDVSTSTLASELASYRTDYYNETEKFAGIIGQDIKIIENISSSTGNGISISEAKKEMSTITSDYQAIINNLIKVPIPAATDSAGVMFHLALINDLEKLIQIDNDMVNSYGTDTASVFSDLSVYNSTISELVMVLDTLDTVLKIKR
jgi:hypothetical protein